MSSPVRLSSFFLEQAFVTGVVVDRTGDRGAEPLLVHPAFERGDAVGEAVQTVGVEAGVPLERDLDLVWVVVDGLGAREVPDGLEQGLLEEFTWVTKSMIPPSYLKLNHPSGSSVSMSHRAVDREHGSQDRG